MKKVGFHDDAAGRKANTPQTKAPQETEFTYTFENFFHPFVGELIRKLNRGTLTDLLDPTFHEALAKQFEGSFERDYPPRPSDTVLFEVAEGVPYPRKEIDVGVGPYAGYN